MNYSQAIESLQSLQMFGARPGLETISRLVARAGNPQNALRFVHVAGTNGKGSTCAMLESVYRTAGLRVGLFTSPHLVCFRERIQINRMMIPEEAVARLVSEMQPWLVEFTPENHPTFFEVVTLLALRHFAEQQCDLVVWETGLGGRLDATNLVTPLASVITNVDFDHEAWLGDTLEKIAAEKAGIIKPGVPVITGAQGGALEVVRQTAAQLGAPLYPVSRPVLQGDLGLRGAHQRMNAAVALKTVEVLAGIFPVPPALVCDGLVDVQWPGRFQIVGRGAQTIILDGAHNPAGAEALTEALRAEFGDGPFAFIIGMLEDKNWRAAVGTFARGAHQMICVPVASKRTALPVALAHAAQAANPGLTVHSAASIAEALSLVEAVKHVVITGSLYLIGEALEQLGETPPTNERGLNEWSPRAVK